MTRVYDRLAQTFLNESVTTCFGLLGDADMNWATRMAEGGCRMIHMRHEHCAVATAMAFARKTGGTGVASPTFGPGLTQIVSVLPAAVRAEGLNDVGAVFGHPDLAAVARAFGAAGQRVDDQCDLPRLTAAARRVALWDFPVSDRIASPVMQRAHPAKGHA